LPKTIKNDIEGESKEENLILQALAEEPLYIDKIIEKTKLNASAVAVTISLMEISGKIRSLGTNIYSLNN
jgi:predicted Rossmann fold nucleotide-binding protein DprA/Smf involved in DNA uptake